jgi:hypothetical protein
MDEIRTTLARCVALTFGVPDLLDLQQSAVTTSHVVLAEVERRAPAGPFELAAVCLLENRTVLALAEQPLAGCRESSGHHGAILEHAACGTSVPIGCELRPQPWGQAPNACARAVGSPGEDVYRSPIRS